MMDRVKELKNAISEDEVRKATKDVSDYSATLCDGLMHCTAVACLCFL